jgi:hypothetical protein
MKHRAISWVLIPLALAGFVYKGMVSENILLKDVLLNIAFVSVQLVLLTVYMSIKNKRLVNIVDTYLGLGDVLFFVVICAAFSTLNFIVFYLVSMIITLTGAIAYNGFRKKKSVDIPLAGAMAGILIVLMLIPGVGFYDDGYLLEVAKKIM